MAIKVQWNESPRIITIQAPTTDITIQELSDQIKDFEDELLANSHWEAEPLWELRQYYKTLKWRLPPEAVPKQFK